MKVVSVRTLATALAALRDTGPDARILAGGTDLMVEMESGRTRPAHVVDVWRVDELRGVRPTSAGLWIGALTSCSELLRSEHARQHADVLIEAARSVGAVAIRNRATIGGNLGTASPAADLNPVLFALGARVRLASWRGERELAVEQFIRGYRATAREPDELITGVVIPGRPALERRAFRKVGTRRAQSISKVVIATAVTCDGQQVTSARFAAGSVADRTVLFEALAQELIACGLPADPDLHELCRRGVDATVSPRDDVRSTARYRRFVTIRVLEDILRAAVRPR